MAEPSGPRTIALTDARVWDAIDDWRWMPPSSRRETTPSYDLVVTPGSFALTTAYALSVDQADRVGEVLRDLRARVMDLGGTGVRVQVTPRSRPDDLGERLLREGFELREVTDILAWELRDREGNARLPDFRPSPGISVREIDSEVEYERYQELTSTVFGDPRPSLETRRAFVEAFRARIRDTGHSDRFLASEGPHPVGLAGMEVAGPVARMFGSGVLPSLRGRGVYGLLVRARCEEGSARGAEMALVTARVGTSGPILQHHGFRAFGTLKVFEARF
jgi:GNAT superfamily N-acetyltransferase